MPSGSARPPWRKRRGPAVLPLTLAGGVALASTVALSLAIGTLAPGPDAGEPARRPATSAASAAAPSAEAGAQATPLADDAAAHPTADVTPPVAPPRGLPPAVDGVQTLDLAGLAQPDPAPAAAGGSPAGPTADPADDPTAGRAAGPGTDPSTGPAPGAANPDQAGAAALTTAPVATAAFSVAGVTWDAESDVSAVRVRSYGEGVWSDWQELEIASQAGGPDPDSREGRRAVRGTEPFVAADSSGIQVQVLTAGQAPAPEGLQATLIDPAGLDATAPADPLAEPDRAPADPLAQPDRAQPDRALADPLAQPDRALADPFARPDRAPAAPA
ncbi:MAG: hypothetical protein LBT54_06455, partial [Bifidobacteriaceae bacterium]|nr:hypothetical protein [Bifidobacteriaceae bacterium]